MGQLPDSYFNKEDLYMAHNIRKDTQNKFSLTNCKFN